MSEQHTSEIVIRVIQDVARAREAERLQRLAWGMPPEEAVPLNQMITAARWGGMLLIAYQEEEPVGFCYGFVGLEAGRPLLCSHMLGVVPGQRSRGIGYALKLEQRRVALGRGLDRIVWTFDPLEARNGYLNLHKLDAFAERYYIDAYGPMDDELNKGMPSDRLLVDWRADEARPSSDRPPAPLDPDLPVINPSHTSEAPRSSGGLAGEGLGTANRALIAVPHDIAEVKRTSSERALEWRIDVREAMTMAFARGYRVTDLVPGDESVAFYVLEKEGTKRADR